jgi:hypothetical protein
VGGCRDGNGAQQSNGLEACARCGVVVLKSSSCLVRASLRAGLWFSGFVGRCVSGNSCLGAKVGILSRCIFPLFANWPIAYGERGFCSIGAGAGAGASVMQGSAQTAPSRLVHELSFNIHRELHLFDLGP